MDIGPIVVDRGDARSYCGLLTMRDASGEAACGASVEALDAARVRHRLRQGERPDWLEEVELHAPTLSDAILAAIATRPRAAVAA